MYVPGKFSESDQMRLQQYIRDYSFGLLILADDQGIEANHVPFLLKTQGDDDLGVLQCHLARANPVWQRLKSATRVLAVFQGPDAYITPSWYPTKAETGRVVPTWNYLAVHAEGTARVINDPVWLREHVSQLTNRHESDRSEPWSVDDAPKEYTDGLMKAIVGVEIRLDSLIGKLKASQNQPERNREGVRSGLTEPTSGTQTTMKDLIP